MRGLGRGEGRRMRRESKGWEDGDRSEEDCRGEGKGRGMVEMGREEEEKGRKRGEEEKGKKIR